MTIRIYLDSNVFIYAFEGTVPLQDYARAVLDMVRSGEATAVISELVVAELLVKPLSIGDSELGDAYAELFNSPSGYETCPIDRNTLLEAARQRARNSKIRLPDAIHLSTARLRHCAAFVSHDGRIDFPHDLIGETLSASTVSNIRALS